eukprot:7822215-Pyramimonas_sp.AAC.1
MLGASRIPTSDPLSGIALGAEKNPHQPIQKRRPGELRWSGKARMEEESEEDEDEGEEDRVEGQQVGKVGGRRMEERE